MPNQLPQIAPIPPPPLPPAAALAELRGAITRAIAPLAVTDPSLADGAAQLTAPLLDQIEAALPEPPALHPLLDQLEDLLENVLFSRAPHAFPDE
jgi:hypothetical protein